MILMITGLAFKVSAAPMHVWTPDVYEGAPSPVVAFFASAPKLAMMIVFANVMFTAFSGAIADWQADHRRSLQGRPCWSARWVRFWSSAISSA